MLASACANNIPGGRTHLYHVCGVIGITGDDQSDVPFRITSGIVRDTINSRGDCQTDFEHNPSRAIPFKLSTLRSLASSFVAVEEIEAVTLTATYFASFDMEAF